MSLHLDSPVGTDLNVLCDYCRSNHVHLYEDSTLSDPRLSAKLSGWILEIDRRNFDACPECMDALIGDTFE